MQLTLYKRFDSTESLTPQFLRPCGRALLLLDQMPSEVAVSLRRFGGACRQYCAEDLLFRVCLPAEIQTTSGFGGRLVAPIFPRGGQRSHLSPSDSHMAAISLRVLLPYPRYFASTALTTTSGSRPETSPPYLATSLHREDET